MTDAIAHRGPDGQALWIAPDQSAGFGHRRLAILDTSNASAQPMVSSDGRWTMVYNGEIYNFIEVRRELAAIGVFVKSDGDTEVLLCAWAAWGWDMLPRLNGMWAFAIRDNMSGKVYLGRDRFGVKPLVYTNTARGFYFASEAKALLALPWLDRTIDPAMVQRIVFDPFSHEGSERALFANIRKLPAGHCGEYHEGNLKVRRWWNTLDNLEPRPKTLIEAGEQFRDLFTNSVTLRMRSDVPIGTCLSGGFDSSAVIGTMASIGRGDSNHSDRVINDWQHSFVAAFPGHDHDETAQARTAADFAGIDPVIMDFSQDQGTDLLEECLNALDDIYISLPAAIWKTYRGVRMAGIKVTLDGHGADEAFGGYRTGGDNIAFHVRNMLGANVGRSSTARRAADHIRRIWFLSQSQYFLRTSAFSPLPIIEIAANHDTVPDSWSVMDRRLYGMFHSDILPTLLRNFDRLSMAHGVEIRMPFMDWRLVCFVMSLPSSMKADRHLTKIVARAGLKGLLPETIRTSPRKVGFNSQMPAWMNGSLGKWAEHSLAKPHPLMESLFDMKRLRQTIKANNDHHAWTWSSSDRIWPYVNMNWYLNKHV